MIKFVCKITILPVLLMLSACSTLPPHNYFSDEALNKIDTIDLYITIPQKELQADITSSNTTAAAGGGLLFALVDLAVENSRASTAEELIEPIRNSLLDLNFNEMFKQKLEEGLKDESWTKISKTILNNEVSVNQTSNDFKSSSADAIFYINAAYSLSADFSNITAKAELFVVPRNKSLRIFSEKPDSTGARKSPWNKNNNIFRDNLVVVETFSGSVQKIETNAELLAKNPEMVKSLYPKLIDKLVKDILWSLRLRKNITSQT